MKNEKKGHFFLEGYLPMAATVRTLEDPEKIEVTWKSGPWVGQVVEHSALILEKFTPDKFSEETVEFKGVEVVQHSEGPDPFESATPVSARLSDWDDQVLLYIEAKRNASEWEARAKAIRDDLLPELASGELMAATDENGLSHRLKLSMVGRGKLDTKRLVQKHPEVKEWLKDFTVTTEYPVVNIVPFNEEAEERAE